MSTRRGLLIVVMSISTLFACRNREPQDADEVGEVHETPTTGTQDNRSQTVPNVDTLQTDTTDRDSLNPER
jgi:hypothetical protein